MTRLISIVVVVAALACAEALAELRHYHVERKAEGLRRRLRDIGAAGEIEPIFRQRRLAKSKLIATVLDGIGLFGGLERLLGQTDLNLTVAKFLSLTLGLAGLGLLAGSALLHNPPAAMALAAAGVLGPLLWVRSAREKRSAKISEQLPDALEMMARATKAGYSIPSVFKLVAQECAAPIAVEFANAYEQQHFGVAFEQAVVSLTEHVPNNLDLRLFAVSVLIQRETGGNLVEVLENISQTLRERTKFASKLRALTAEGKLSALILGSLPWLMALFLLATNPRYLEELTVGSGRILLLAGLGGWCLGMLWIQRLTKVEF